jgi:hypothetical protein
MFPDVLRATGCPLRMPEEYPEAIPLAKAIARSKPEGWNEGLRPNGALTADIA